MRPLEKWGEQALKEIGRPEARLATKVVRLEKANQLQRKRGDVPRACPVETPATGAQLAATGAKSPPGRASCFAMQGQCAAGAGRPSHLRGYCSRLAGKIGSETPECQGEGRTAFIGGTSGVKPSSFAAFRTVWRVQIREKGHKRFYPVTEGRARRPLKRLCPVCWRIHNRSLTANIIKFFVKKHRIQLKLTGIFQNKSTCKLVCGAHRFTEEEAAQPEGAAGVHVQGSCGLLPGPSTGFSCAIVTHPVLDYSASGIKHPALIWSLPSRANPFSKLQCVQSECRVKHFHFPYQCFIYKYRYLYIYL